MTRDDIKISPSRIATVLGILGGITVLWLFVTGALDRNYVTRREYELQWVRDSAWRAQIFTRVDRMDARIESIWCEGQPADCRERLRRP